MWVEAMGGGGFRCTESRLWVDHVGLKRRVLTATGLQQIESTVKRRIIEAQEEG